MLHLLEAIVITAVIVFIISSFVAYFYKEINKISKIFDSYFNFVKVFQEEIKNQRNFYNL